MKMKIIQDIFLASAIIEMNRPNSGNTNDIFDNYAGSAPAAGRASIVMKLR